MERAPQIALNGLHDSCEAGRSARELHGFEDRDEAIARDLAAARSHGIAIRALIGLLVLYKRWVSPLLPQSCRFTPSCSEYARLAVLKHGPLRGAWLALRRVVRCNPFHPGGVDLP